MGNFWWGWPWLLKKCSLSFPPGLRQPMRLPCKAKWHLWTSSQVQTIHSKTKDEFFHARCQLCCVAYGCCAVCTGLCAKYCYSHQPIHKVDPCVCPQSVISYCAALEMTRWDSSTSGRTPSRLPSGLAVALCCPVSFISYTRTSLDTTLGSGVVGNNWEWNV